MKAGAETATGQAKQNCKQKPKPRKNETLLITYKSVKNNIKMHSSTFRKIKY